jgi:MoxR-like ATPase
MKMIQFNNTLSYAETATAIAAIGHKRTVYVEGDMGSGKTSLMKELCRMYPDHIPVVIDGTRMEIGDLVVPMFDKIDDAGIVTYAINEAFGVHLNKPMIFNIDEIAKAPRPVQNALT